MSDQVWRFKVRQKLKKGAPPRKLTDDEQKELLEDQLKRPPASLNREALRNEMKYRNPYRWQQLERQYTWLQKQMLKMGLNPEDARWLL